jgi:copper chaperone CopZ
MITNVKYEFPDGKDNSQPQVGERYLCTEDLAKSKDSFINAFFTSLFFLTRNAVTSPLTAVAMATGGAPPVSSDNGSALLGFHQSSGAGKSMAAFMTEEPSRLPVAADDWLMTEPAVAMGASAAPAGMAQQATVQVLGMTCNSCVQNIEGVMGDRPGIESIRVSLADEEAVVRYYPAQWTPHAIADAIDDVCVTFFLYTLFQYS